MFPALCMGIQSEKLRWDASTTPDAPSRSKSKAFSRMRSSVDLYWRTLGIYPRLLECSAVDAARTTFHLGSIGGITIGRGSTRGTESAFVGRHKLRLQVIRYKKHASDPSNSELSKISELKKPCTERPDIFVVSRRLGRSTL